MKIITLCGGHDSNFTYILIENRKAVLIDSALPAAEIFSEARKQNAVLEAVFILHSHFDHIVELEAYREAKISLYAHDSAPFPVDKKLRDGEQLTVAGMRFTVLHTPGHRFDAICLRVENCLFTSDTLFVHGCGRTDLPGSDPQQLLASFQKLWQLPDDTIIYPGHDYGPTKTSTIQEEKKFFLDERVFKIKANL